MIVRFLFSSSRGDIPLDESLRSRPFLLNPGEEHPHLKLEDYFSAIHHFLFVRNEATLQNLLGRIWGKPLRMEDIEEALIRSEKHGTLYHLASAEILSSGSRARFAVSTAVSEVNRKWLTQEFGTLKDLQETFHLPFLPETHLLDTIEWETPGGPVTLGFMLSQWLEDYHEWHLSRNESGETNLIIWDLQRGYRKATEGESREIVRQASKILTLYYNIRSSHHIHPWHHAAGDFVVKSAGAAVEVKLTTARGYEPLMIFTDAQDIHPVMALLTFFLNLTIRMRLDRWDGVGEVAWAPDFSVRATVEGFFEALTSMEKEGRFDPGGVNDFSLLLKTFRGEELRRICLPLLEFYGREGKDMLSVIERELDGHVRSLQAVIQGLPG